MAENGEEFGVDEDMSDITERLGSPEKMKIALGLAIALKKKKVSAASSSAASASSSSLGLRWPGAGSDAWGRVRS